MDAEKIKELYWVNKFSTRKIANIMHTHQRAVINFMKTHNIQRRERIQAVIQGCKKYEKKEFSGNVCEKAYLMGFILADFRRRRHGYQIDIASGSTHPAFISLFESLFEKYAPTHKNSWHNRKMNRYGYRVDAQLHPSFDFLLEPKTVPNWAMENNDIFLHFLAGYTDGEGILSISKNDPKYVSYIFAISSGDLEILTNLLVGLRAIGFSPSFRKHRAAGEFNILCGQKLTYTKDNYTLIIKRKEEVLKLLEILPIKHSEKVRKRELMFKLSKSSLISDTLSEWKDLKQTIKQEVDSYIIKAKNDYLSRKDFNISSALK